MVCRSCSQVSIISRNPQARDLSSLGKISERTVLKIVPIVKCKLVNGSIVRKKNWFEES